MFDDGFDIDYQKFDEYASPVLVAMQQNVETEVIDKVMQVAQKYAVHVDENRLLEILKSDRAAYYKGRHDAEFQIAHSNRLTLNGFDYIRCTCCGKLTLDTGEEFVKCVYCHMIGNVQ